MKSVAALILLAAAAMALPRPDAPIPVDYRSEQLSPGIIPVLARHDVRDDSGQFAQSYLGGDGTHVSEQGHLVPNEDGTDYVLIKKGEYSYTSPEGRAINLQWVADQQGFKAISDSIPVGPVA